MPLSTPEAHSSEHRGRGLRVFTVADLDQLTARAGLAPGRREKIRVAAAKLGFRVTSYVTDELIDWSAAPEDPVYRLVFPSEDVLDEAAAGGVAGQYDSRLPGHIDNPAQQAYGVGAASSHRRFGEQVLTGVHRSYHDTVSVVVPHGPARSFGITCPGRDWPEPRVGPALAARDAPLLAGYLAANADVTVAEFTGGDPLTMDAAQLRRVLEPLLTVEHLVSIRLRTAALARWPYRFLADPDADQLLRLFEEVSKRGKTLALTADFSHPRELEPDPARKAVGRIRSCGAVIYTEGTLTGTVNDEPGLWTAMWRAQARLGLIPCALVLEPVTGPGRYFTVPLSRAQQIFARAYANVSGLARTVRGPVMRDGRGLVCIDGITVAGGQKMFVLRYLQARDPHLIGTPFFATFSADAAWLTELLPAPGTRSPGTL